jgi:glycosyltransferase involved in cell wall biosynthesis
MELCHVGVDLTHMIVGGANGGLKPAILTFLHALGSTYPQEFRFTYLSNSSTHEEMRSLLRPPDALVCVSCTPGYSWPKLDHRGGQERVIKDYQPKHLRRLGVEVFYCPFGPTDRSHPRVPTVSLVADLLHRDYPFSISAWERQWREDYFRALVVDADVIQGISRYTLSRLQKYYRVRRKALFFTYLPIEERLQVTAPAAPGRSYFLYPANFWLHKNHDVLLVAFQKYVRETADPWDLVLTGHLDERGRWLQALARNLQIEGRVQFAGHVPEPRLAEIWAGAGALIYPSLHEGFGIPLVEAMRFHKPIISSRCTSIPEIVRDAGLCVEVKNPGELATAMARVSDDPELRRALVERGRRRLADFSLEQEVEKLRNALHRAHRSAVGLASAARWWRRWRRRQRIYRKC